jgi:(4-O-methyl)-D-glucuronate---lignin esterase
MPKTRDPRIALIAAAALISALALSGPLMTALAQSDPPPAELTSAEDHQRTLSLLGIDSLRRGANGSDPEADNYANYDESIANPYPVLPDPLLLNDRERVTTPEMWWNQRRDEIVELFDREVYGRVPENTPDVDWEVVETVRETLAEVPVITKRLVGHVDNSSYPQITVDIQLRVSTPAAATGPVPVMMQFGGGFAGGRGGGAPQVPAWQQQVLAKGWGFAQITPNSIQADNGAGLTEGIIGLMNRGQPRDLDDWGALRAWAWGASRALDYFGRDDAVDATQVGLEGHSRYGKATIVAMAYDRRFAIAYVSSSGAGGVKLNRRNWGELVENVAATNEYHWMAGNYMKYAGPLTWDDMPVDSHELVALAAPRPVFIGAGARKATAGWTPRACFWPGPARARSTSCSGPTDWARTSFHRSRPPWWMAKSRSASTAAATRTVPTGRCFWTGRIDIFG